MVTIAILFYSTFAAIYYAKYTYLHEQPSEEDGDIFLRSGRARSKRDINEVLRAIHTPPT
ncbi:hypothetical protein O3M35_009012 [Rhynocoris fuscipes]|uniref:Uncharacterized protein n=1 Tax=Rhynocoris fuscipes TaxID=488301 RepID=A0AAW1D2P6_9HEMI